MDKHAMAALLREKGWPAEEARGIWGIEGSNMFIDVTKGAQFLQEVKDMVLAGWRWGIKDSGWPALPVQGIQEGSCH